MCNRSEQDQCSRSKENKNSTARPKNTVYQSPMQILQSDIAECNDNINETICKGHVQANYLPKNIKFSGQF